MTVKRDAVVVVVCLFVFICKNCNYSLTMPVTEIGAKRPGDEFAVLPTKRPRNDLVPVAGPSKNISQVVRIYMWMRRSCVVYINVVCLSHITKLVDLLGSS